MVAGGEHPRFLDRRGGRRAGTTRRQAVMFGSITLKRPSMKRITEV